ncbi:MAG: S-methyl-5-thioribose-1-phosphate isomerase [Planctomycetes bacterium]|nr:S-methyl-5-thioribose-1-phosphate isomerase [Planctomycetota bacterium]
MTAPNSANIDTLNWVGDIDGHLRMIDQTLLPVEFLRIDLRDVETVWEAIKMLRVRGAPAIGIAAAYGVCVGVQNAVDGSVEGFFSRLNEVADYLASSRPTAVNLFWALERMRKTAELLRNASSPRDIAAALLAEARVIHEEDRRMCRAMGRHGAALLEDGQGVLTHCNAGGLATADYGTALAVFFAAAESGKRLHVYADETRPLLQGARLTAWELQQRGIEVTVICDSMAAQVMREGRIQAVVTGADRIAANGDAANKIGTYGVAVAAAAHDIPFYVAAPSSTFDLSLASGDLIPIEQRDPREITHGFGRQTAPDGVDVYNPAFDVTPARLIKSLICEHGLIEPVTTEEVARVLSLGPEST